MMKQNRKIIINDYLQKVSVANKETAKKEHFKDLLHRLYSDVSEVQKIIDSISAGAEKTVLNIPRNDGRHGGRADTLYNKIIIEFENDISSEANYNHAKIQLAGYLLGQYNSGEGYNFTLIATDGIRWKIVTPDVNSVSNLDQLTESELVLKHIDSVSFTLTENNTDDFYYWIDRFLFKEEKLNATLNRIEESFGYNSNIFLECFRQLSKVFNDAKKYGEVQVSYEQWKKFLSIAYGRFEDTTQNFIIHTYLSIFAKILAYEVISNDDYIDDRELEAVLNGSIFNKYSIKNFVDNDFFHWVHEKRYINKLKPVFRLITQEISNYNFNDVNEDVLKGIYQELIDIDTRHTLGEYYTPDWLCERILNDVEIEHNTKILDPSCGSGSFLRIIINKIKQEYPNHEAADINKMVFGIDIHPLSVQIAKTTVLIALGKSVVNSRRPIQINVILANTLLAPEGTKDLFGSDFIMNIDSNSYKLNTAILDDVKIFDDALQICEDLANRNIHNKMIDRNSFVNVLNKQTNYTNTNKNIEDSFYKIYQGFKKTKEQGRDSIWKFIIQNLYKPYFLNKRFDYVIGNPPWFTFSSIRNKEYQNILDELATIYNVKPKRVANFPHLEIAAIFLVYCSNYYLKNNGKISFVLPRSFLNADHHDNTRSGKSKGFILTSIWDLGEVTPLFNVPSCVFWGKSVKVQQGNSDSSTNGIKFKGKLPYNNCTWDIASEKLIEKNTTWYYSKLGKSSAFSTKKMKIVNKINPYASLFRQGATIVPRVFYFIDINQDIPPDFIDRKLNIKTADYIQSQAKKPWKGLDFSGKIDSQFLFYTALSNSILPFAFHDSKLITLPIQIKKNTNEEKAINLYSGASLLSKGYLDTSRWFQNTERIWDIFKTEKNAGMTSFDYINWQNKLVTQNLNKQYLVLYNSSAKDVNATVVERSKFDLEFIVESKTYVFYSDKLNEAYYLIGILNSAIPNKMIKDFQTRGLFGARDIHKKILDVYFPKFNPENKIHIKLAEISKQAHSKTTIYLKSNKPENNLSPYAIGRLRLEVKNNLVNEMREIDRLVKIILSD